MARTGRPSGRNSVRLVDTDLTTPTNGVAVPHENTTIGGYGVSLLSDFSVGRTVLSSLSIVLDTSPAKSSVASRNISTSSVRSWVPVNSGCSPVVLVALKFQSGAQRGAVVLGVEVELQDAEARARLEALLALHRLAQVELGLAPGWSSAAAPRQISPGRRKPWWASSSVSVATLAVSTESDGPCHFTGMTSRRAQMNTGVASWFFDDDLGLGAHDVPFIRANQAAIFAVSAVTGRVSLMLPYLMRPGSWWT